MHLCISRPERGAIFCKRSNIENIISLQRRHRGRVVTTVLDLYFGGLEITPRPDRLLGFVLDSPEIKSSARHVK